MRVLLLLLVTFILVSADIRDVCIQGSSASGMSAAVFLKDKGYDVLVIEKEPEIGGHCNTYFFTPPAPGLPNWIDIGVQVYDNTTYLNEIGFGQWNLDTAAFAQRFAPGLLNPVDFTKPLPVFEADIRHNISYGQVNETPGPAFYTAFAKLFQIGLQYPWLNNADYPDPIPSELLVPFSDFIISNDLEPLNELVFRELLGGLGDFQNLTTLYALPIVSPASLLFITTPNVTFSILGGCIQIYNGIRNYLGPQNVLTNTLVTLALRSPTHSNIPTILFLDNGTNIWIERCRKLIVAFPPILEDLLYLLPTPAEIDVFKYAQPRYYYVAEANVTGPMPDVGSYVFNNIDLTQPFNDSVRPALLGIQRGLPYGPSATGMDSNTYLTDKQAYQILSQQLAGVPNSLATTKSIINFRSHNRYQPHFVNSSLTQSPNPYTRLEALQGQQNTYFLSVLQHYAVSAQMWEASYDLVNKYF